MPEVVVQAESIGKKYVIRHQAASRLRYKSLRESLAIRARRILSRAASVSGGNGAGNGPRPAAPTEEFWALSDVSFAVEQGDVLGVIGQNGAGKSTLLKILSRITEPTRGRVTIHGRLASLLEVGTGFHPELTGRENIFLNGAILGMRRAEIQSKFDEIVAFAEIEKFLDTPVKRFSSGMYMRLAFAVAAHLEPEILLIDEVLAVGDASFQRKCLGKMGEVAGRGRTVFFVSHNMTAVRQLCSRVIWLERGSVRMEGTPEAVISKYLSEGANAQGQVEWAGGVAAPGEKEFLLRSLRVLGPDGAVSTALEQPAPFDIEIRYSILRKMPFCRVGFLIQTYDGITVFEAYDVDDERFAGEREPGEYVARCRIPGKLLNGGSYFISVNAGIPYVRALAQQPNALRIELQETSQTSGPIVSRYRGVVRPEMSWSREIAGMPAENSG